MKGFIAMFIGMLLIVNPFYVYGQDDSQIKARAALLMEVETGNILFQNNIDEQMGTDRQILIPALSGCFRFLYCDLKTVDNQTIDESTSPRNTAA